MRREAPPADRASQAELVELPWIVVGDTPREDLPFPGIRRRFKSLQLPQRFQQTALAQQLRARRNALPTEQPVHELRRSHGLDLLAQLPERKAMDAGQQAALTPFRFTARGIRKISAENDSAGFQAKQHFVDIAWRKSQHAGDLRRGNRANVG